MRRSNAAGTALKQANGRGYRRLPRRLGHHQGRRRRQEILTLFDAAAHVKKALQAAADPLILVISGDIYRAIVRHGYDGIDQRAFHPLVRVRIACNRYPGWIHIPGQAARNQVTE